MTRSGGDLAQSPRRPLGTVALDAFGELEPISRSGGQGRVHRPLRVPQALGRGPVVVKLYRRQAPAAAAEALTEMVLWGRSLEAEQRAWLHRVSAWPVAVVDCDRAPVGIVMEDVRQHFSVPFLMPSGRRDRVLLALEHLLGADAYLQQRGLDVALDTVTRARVAERISGALAFLHRHAIVVSDIAPSNLLVSVTRERVSACFIDCDSMVFHGSQALPTVETGDWNMPAGFREPARTRAADAYKLGLIVLRLFARSHDARGLAPHAEHVPQELHALMRRALAADVRNRPPAGEWQRALHHVLVDPRLGERWPGPVRRRPRPAVPGPRRVMPPGPALVATARASALVPNARAPGLVPTARAPVRTAGSTLWLRRTVVVLWILVGTVTLGLILSRMFASAIPTPPSGGGSTPAFYYAPAGGGTGFYQP